jgi:hypothetical protein
MKLLWFGGEKASHEAEGSETPEAPPKLQKNMAFSLKKRLLAH